MRSNRSPTRSRLHSPTQRSLESKQSPSSGCKRRATTYLASPTCDSNPLYCAVAWQRLGKHLGKTIYTPMSVRCRCSRLGQHTLRQPRIRMAQLPVTCRSVPACSGNFNMKISSASINDVFAGVDVASWIRGTSSTR